MRWPNCEHVKAGHCYDFFLLIVIRSFNLTLVLLACRRLCNSFQESPYSCKESKRRINRRT